MMTTCREMARKWDLSERAVAKMCKNGRIPGAVKAGKSWQIPEDALRPADGRVSSGKYIKSSSRGDISRGAAVVRETSIPFSTSTE